MRRITATEVNETFTEMDRASAELNARIDAVCAQTWQGFFGSGWIHVGGQTPDQIVDPMDAPLPVKPPDDWKGREDRVRWLVVNLTCGEKAMLYRLLHDAEGLAYDKCRSIERGEKQKCSS